MSVAGYEKVKTKVIEGKKKCIYKKHKGTKLYVKGFGKMRSVESYVKLCKKAAASKASQPKKTKKTRSKSAKKYGGFLQDLFANMESESFANDDKKKADKFSDMSNSMNVSSPATPATPPSAAHTANTTPPALFTNPANHSDKKMGGSSCSKNGGYRGGKNVSDPVGDDAGDGDGNQEGGKRRKKYKSPKSMFDKLMLATFRKRSANKKNKKYNRKGGNLLNSLNLMA